MPVRKLSERRGWAFTLGAVILRPTLSAATSRTWLGGDHVPATGGCVIAVNHITKVDPLFVAHYLYDHGRIARYLAKSGLFEVAGLGTFLHGAGQIPVERESAGTSAYAAAVEAVRAGACVVVYPEGTITRDPDLWPMTAKSGAARIALATGAPVVPVGHWGAQELLAPYGSRPQLVPRKHVTVAAGPPVDLDDLRAGPVTATAAAAATGRIMSAVTGIVAGIRGETPPDRVFDARAAGLSEYGRPRHVDGAGSGSPAPDAPVRQDHGSADDVSNDRGSDDGSDR